MVYSLVERVEIIELYFKNNECSNRVPQIFNECHPEKHLYGKIVRELVAKCPKDIKKTEVPPVQNSVGTRTQRRRF